VRLHDRPLAIFPDKGAGHPYRTFGAGTGEAPAFLDLGSLGLDVNTDVAGDRPDVIPLAAATRHQPRCHSPFRLPAIRAHAVGRMYREARPHGFGASTAYAEPGVIPPEAYFRLTHRQARP
jgi:hypothetical protein